MAPVSGEPTNNRAEYEAILAAMKQARDKGLRALTICTDSKLLISSMDNWLKKWKENGWKTVNGGNVRNKDLLEAIDGVRKDVSVQFHHVNGHVGIHGNEMADALAREGARKFLAKKALK
uniref:ribonuclease H n=1 Tax=Panagrolaimus davidi TaxID=227884 RepID=A0A914PVE1_9BILA